MSPSTRRGVTEQAAIAAIDSGARVLRLPTIRDRFEEIAAAAEREQLSYLGFLAELVMAECDDRDKRRAARRIHDAGFPRDKRLEEFDFAANPGVSPAVIHQLATCAWVKAGHPLCLIGDSGTGKSHLLIGLGTAAAEAGHRVRYTLASKLVNELVEAADDKQLSKTIARYGRVDLLCLDELGYMELDRHGAELLFQVLTEREERSAIAIASTSRSPAGPRPSPTRASARPSSTDSPSPDRSSRPAPPPTGWPTPANGAPPADHDQQRVA
jgi:DNA replication protein DnaC